jgi:hypothetical protein
MVCTGKQPADFAERRAAAISALNELLARLSNVYLLGCLHTDALVECSSAKLVDEKRAPLDCVFLDARGARWLFVFTAILAGCCCKMSGST